RSTAEFGLETRPLRNPALAAAAPVARTAARLVRCHKSLHAARHSDGRHYVRIDARILAQELRRLSLVPSAGLREILRRHDYLERRRGRSGKAATEPDGSVEAGGQGARDRHPHGRDSAAQGSAESHRFFQKEGRQEMSTFPGSPSPVRGGIALLDPDTGVTVK